MQTKGSCGQGSMRRGPRQGPKELQGPGTGPGGGRVWTQPGGRTGLGEGSQLHGGLECWAWGHFRRKSRMGGPFLSPCYHSRAPPRELHQGTLPHLHTTSTSGQQSFIYCFWLFVEQRPLLA